MSDAKTLAFYAEKAAEYAQKVSRTEPDGDLTAFMALLPEGGLVLDLGCGPGNSAAMMRIAGFDIHATDASPEMVALARETYGIEARVARFDALDAEALYDGIWANFSLLHAPRTDMPAHLSAIARALKPGGILHLGLKTGTTEAADDLGRFYCYYEADEMRGLLHAAHLTLDKIRCGVMDGLAQSNEPYMILTCRKPAK